MKLTQICLCSRNAIAIIISSVVTSLMMVGTAQAQPKPSCYMVESSGKLIDLVDICDAKPIATTQSERATDDTASVDRLETPYLSPEIVYVVGDGSLPFALDRDSSIYYTSDRPVYIRRYRESRVFEPNNYFQRSLLELGANHRNNNDFNDLPFLIYQY